VASVSHFRRATTRHRAGKQIAFTGPSLSGLWSAVRGLGVTLRTTAAIPAGVGAIDRLPPLSPLRRIAFDPPGDPAAGAQWLRGWLLARFHDASAIGR